MRHVQRERIRVVERGALVRVIGQPQYPPVNATDRLRSHFIRCIQDLHVPYSPCLFVPTRLGSSETIDLTVRALVKVHGSATSADNAKVLDISILATYGQALALLQRAFASTCMPELDEAVVAAEIIGIVDYLLRLGDADRTMVRACLVHWAGIGALIKAKASAWKPSEVVRAALYTGGIRTFYQPAFTGTASPFDEPRWVDLDPPFAGALVHLSSVRKLAYQLFVQLPGLIRDVRSLKAGASGVDASDVIAGAQRLLMLEDKPAETWLLHRIRLVKTTDEADRVFTPFSFHWTTITEMDVAVNYWQTHLMLLRLYAVLRAGYPECCHGTPNAPVLASEELRLAKNIIMCWQFTKAHLPIGGMSMTLALLVAWNAIRNQSALQEPPAQTMGIWLRKTIKRSFVGWMFGESVEDMDAAADTLSGGPIWGFTR